ncbi:MAG: hypothetical protein B6D62_04635 [Candidatus Cloacimonas sp. 4484_275]|nr:MAG: hypothetical protein B6D62_04635 [Candidatus Cloacimonas sp. 4484_275]
MKRVDFEIAKKIIKNPSKIAIAVTKDENEKKINLITLEWFMRTSINPPMFAISVGHRRYSYSCLQKFRYFNLCFPSVEMKQTALIAGTTSGRNVNKLDLISESFFSGKLAKLPVFENAVANFECEIFSQIRSGDHTIFIGKVKYSWIGENQNLLLGTEL